MLKIKDNVDLKELEKFGFKEHEDYKDTLTDGKLHIELYDSIYNVPNTRKIYALSSGYLDSLYDLIQAGLVEKVEE